MHPNLCCVAVERERNRVNLLHRNWRAELRCIPLNTAAARELAAELVAVASEIEADQPKEADQPAQGEPLVFSYTNWRGETGTRRAIPIRVYHGSTEWHPEPQWLMEAHDVDKDAVRVFAMRDMGQAQGGDIARELAEVLEENWAFLAVWAQQYGRDACGGKMHKGHAEMLARVHSVMTKAHAAGLIKKNTTTRLPVLIAEAGYDMADLLASRASGLLPKREEGNG